MFSALAFLLSSVILPLIWHHRSQYDQRLSRSLQLITDSIGQFRQYQTQRNRAAYLSRQGHTQSLPDVYTEFQQFQHTVIICSQWTQPWFSVGLRSLQLQVNQLSIQHVTARRTQPELAIDLSEAEQETQLYIKLTQARHQLLTYSYLQYIRDQLL
jgi:hypothetical protein